ncbi:hypothetical protein PSAR109036_07095 [Psychrobacter arenosus]|uniref:hypothetical protein n=1 Tax=Psychrobacter arenosus TaxID=256326 RepID=UPI0019198E05|nr:hypothetical protein [Psychrobacter arenosus]
MKPTIENATNPYYQVGSMTTTPKNFLLSSASTIAKLDNSDKANYSPLAIGCNRQDCLTYLEQRNIKCVNFAHWLAIPALHLLLVFKGQCCVAVEQQLITP